MLIRPRICPFLPCHLWFRRVRASNSVTADSAGGGTWTTSRQSSRSVVQLTPAHSFHLSPSAQGCAVRCVKTVTMAIPWDNQGRLGRARDATATATWTSTPWEYATTSPGDVWNAWDTQRATSANAAGGGSTGTPWTRQLSRSAGVSHCDGGRGQLVYHVYDLFRGNVFMYDKVKGIVRVFIQTSSFSTWLN